MIGTILGVYEDEELLISALQKLQDEKIEISEVLTPYPVHEVFKIMKRKTRLPLATFLFCVLGVILTYLFLYWASVLSYPLIFGGKPLNSIPSFILICFVMMIFFGVFLSVIAFFVRSKLYPGKKAKIHYPRITDNAFVIMIDKKPEMSSNDIKQLNSILKDHGAVEVLEK
ncbi:MAG: hypothetical protein A2X05_01680 [Bacteroidetes bacterium GWE2_41_25]|nr:MAG: hypothetical protein A2X03_03420 [Bacteroidetes bacterium GWA2_40_15]OFX98036.1 MAG: hypothetical protein A2X06_12000 [Bacteroidetes bacterium GWC2_40_22]OFY09784.1 MAG: hypothetical protein A2X05_01680 [Bacteroidetes bacterium GWE2_41_25]OFY57764.1 MAG: hypothetical protein A2X04_11115 [Bacteroidetes bacterium GWF2_41_9]HBH83729.1 hypothetical protein [Bacteroidales bacterium]